MPMMEEPDEADEGMDTDAMSMDDEADITVAAEAELASLPAPPLGWVGYEVRVEDGEAVEHSHAPGFVHAEQQSHELVVDEEHLALGPGESVFVGEDIAHTHEPGVFWEFLLAAPDSDPLGDVQGATVAFSSGALEGLPEARVQLRFVVVDLPPREGQTTVHTHPGPEYIYLRDGTIEYETGLADTVELAAGDDAALPPDTAVQKRNRLEEPARFWSWFIVDPEEPFSSEAMFDR